MPRVTNDSVGEESFSVKDHTTNPTSLTQTKPNKKLFSGVLHPSFHLAVYHYYRKVCCWPFLIMQDHPHLKEVGKWGSSQIERNTWGMSITFHVIKVWASIDTTHIADTCPEWDTLQVVYSKTTTEGLRYLECPWTKLITWNQISGHHQTKHCGHTSDSLEVRWKQMVQSSVWPINKYSLSYSLLISQQ